MKVTIDRAKWLTGRNTIKSTLLDDSGNMCCLGFVAKACGATDEQIHGKPFPCAALKVSWPEGFIDFVGDLPPGNSDDVARLIRYNDDPLLPDQAREEIVARHLAKLGIEATFIGEYEDLAQNQTP